MNRKKVSVVVPSYNEENNIVPLYQEIRKNIPESYDAEFIFVDDGSSDCTLDEIKKLKADDPQVFYISFSRNFGHQNALKAGIDHAFGDCVISLDADLQHPPSLIPQLLQTWEQGYDVVYTIRDDKKSGSWFKRVTSSLFYRLINTLSSTRIEPGAADFRLISNQVARQLSKITENYLFIRGLISWMGFRQKSIIYQPSQRHSGKTKYSFSKMLKFAMAGITSFSVKPLRISLIAGAFIALSAIGYGCYAIYVTLFTTLSLPGWGSLIASILFIGGIQLIVLGVIGEYLGKLFLENKKRPNYIVRETNLESDESMPVLR